MSVCRSCGQEILWAKTDAGKTIPLDLALVGPEQAGAMVVHYWSGGIQAQSLKQATRELASVRESSEDEARRLLLANGEAHLSHFASCPNAAEHRGKGTRG